MHGDDLTEKMEVIVNSIPLRDETWRQFCLLNSLLESTLDFVLRLQAMRLGAGMATVREHGRHFNSGRGMTGAGLGVPEDDGPVEDGGCVGEPQGG